MKINKVNTHIPNTQSSSVVEEMSLPTELKPITHPSPNAFTHPTSAGESGVYNYAVT